MKYRRSGPLAHMVLVSALAAGSSAGWTAPLMSVDAQALAHWVHYARLNVGRRHADAPFIVDGGEQRRWWLVDDKGHGSTAQLLRAAARLQALLPASPQAPPVDGCASD